MTDYNKYKRTFRKSCIFDDAIKDCFLFWTCICEYKDKRGFCINATQRIECKENLRGVEFDNHPVDFKIDEISFKQRDGGKI